MTRAAECRAGSCPARRAFLQAAGAERRRLRARRPRAVAPRARAAASSAGGRASSTPTCSCASLPTTRSPSSASTSRWARASPPASPRSSPRSWRPTGRRCASTFAPVRPRALQQPRIRALHGDRRQQLARQLVGADAQGRCARRARCWCGPPRPRWGVPAEEITVDEGRRLAPDLAALGHVRRARRGRMQLLRAEDVALKDPKDWKLIGKTLPRLDCGRQDQRQGDVLAWTCGAPAS